MKVKSIPRDYEEIATRFPSEMKETRKRTGLEEACLLSKLKEVSLLEEFEKDLPELLKLKGEDPVVLTSQEARRHLGIPRRVWDSVLSLVTGEVPSDLAWSNLLPSLTQGRDVWDRRALFWGPDIGRIGTFLDSFYQGPRKLRESSYIVGVFKGRLESALSAISVEVPVVEVTVTKSLLPARRSAASWPETLPKDNSELVALYGADVAQLVNRVCKIRSKAELDDVCQQMWINLFKAQILDKFIQAAKTKLPRTMTLQDVLGYLGISYAQWEAATDLTPQPLSGSRTDPASLYHTEDIKALDSSDFLKGQRSDIRQHPPLSGRGFKSYLLKAVGNHFKNYLRTKSRRHKERTVDPKHVFANNGAGVYHKVSTLEDGGAWEDSLSVADMSAEDLCDLVCSLKKYKVDPRSDQGLAILDYMTQGYTIKDAIKAQVKAAHRQKSSEQPIQP